MTAVEICNVALGFLGQAAIVTLADATVRAQLCTANYATVRDSILEERDWQFASDWRFLPVDDATPESPRWTHQILVPSDSLAIRELVDGSDQPLDWALGDDGILLKDTATSRYFVHGLTKTPSTSPVPGDANVRISVEGESAEPCEVLIDVIVRSSGDNLWLDLRPWIDDDAAASDLVGGVICLAGTTTPDPRSIGLTIAWLDGTYHGDPGGTWSLDDYPLGADVINDYYEVSTSVQDGAYVRLTKQVTDPTVFPANFRKALAHRLASVLAVPLTENRQLEAQQWSLYERTADLATSTDSQQGRPIQGPYISRLKNARNS